MQFNDFQRLPPNLREEYLRQVHGDAMDKDLPVEAKTAIADNLVQVGAIPNDPPAEAVDAPITAAYDRGFHGTAIMAVGALVVIGSFFFSEGIGGGAFESDVFNLSKGLLKLMIFLTGFLLVVIGAVFEAGNRIADALTGR